MRRIEVHHGEHLAADTETQIAAPLDVFSDGRQLTADFSERVDGHVHKDATEWSLVLGPWSWSDEGRRTKEEGLKLLVAQRDDRIETSCPSRGPGASGERNSDEKEDD